MRAAFTSLAVALLALSSVGLSSTAAAQDAEAEARQRYADGVRLVEAGELRAAYAEFEAGYRLSGRPLFLFNMGECARQTDQISRARSAYERYLAVEPEGAMSDTARERLAALPAPTAPTPLPAVALPEEGPTSPQPLATTASAEEPDDGGGDDGVVIGIVTALSVAAAIGAGVALGVHFGTQGPECGVGCVDFR